MRPGQNKRMRGRNNNNNSNRKGPNPLTRSYESNGPDVKIRGTAHHIGEKYLQLARDAQSSGDPVMAESYLQHAEHYFRLIASAQQAQQQAQFGYQRPPGEQAEQDEDNDDDFESLPDRFASPSERQPQQQQPAPQPYEARPQQPYQNGGERQQPYESRGDRQQGDRPQGDRPQGERYDRQNNQPGNYQDRQQDRQYDNRNGRGDRGSYQDRQDRPYQQDRPDRGDRNNQERGNQERGNFEPRGDRPPRDFDNRNARNNRGPRDFRDNGGQPRDPREARQPVVEEPATGLPAFITGSTRPAPEPAEQPRLTAADAAPPTDAADEAAFMRPRRRRRPKPDFAGAEGSEGGEDRQEAPASDPVGD